ncbi:histidine phosphatase family protein [Domibacillus indicus]|uniref:histidine phosphatase family protein n=1 Tax=Domibacillus indicus TaxID=1437523 RepID=UPI000617DC00|nr:histidine phosphatase family protein [Domibacillus indicus]
MQTISLIRHGKSAYEDNRRMNCREFTEWVRAYNEAGVQEAAACPPDTMAAVKAAPLVITSNLKRSMESADYLKTAGRIKSYSVFREAERPAPRWNLPGVKLRPSAWSAFFRTAWCTGYSPGCESLKDALRRAEAGARKLAEYAAEHQHVVLVGHQFFNQLLAVQLIKMGWSGPKKINRKHWSTTVYSIK